jgi:hypothetical protein
MWMCRMAKIGTSMDTLLENRLFTKKRLFVEKLLSSGEYVSLRHQTGGDLYE